MQCFVGASVGGLFQPVNIIERKYAARDVDMEESNSTPLRYLNSCYWCLNIGTACWVVGSLPQCLRRRGYFRVPADIAESSFWSRGLPAEGKAVRIIG